MKNISRFLVMVLLVLPFAGSFAFAQEKKTVTAVVVDNIGPVPGAGVQVKGTTLGASTDLDGKAVIANVPSNAVLVVSCVGYATTEVPVNGQSTINVTLSEDALALSETVVVGYGSQKKVNLTGAVDQVTSEVFEGRAVANAAQMLEGAVANLNISLTDGQPGRSADFNVRGAGSINGGSALVLIDGVEGDPSMLNPNDIESVSVLKDAAASAIYGARAPFGVVLITTKSASEGKMKVQYSATFSLQTPQNVPDVVSDGYVWAEHFAEGYHSYNNTYPSGINKTQQFSLAWLEQYKQRHDSGNFGTVVSDGTIGDKGRYVYYPEGTDFFKELYKKHTFSQTQNVSVSGSDGKFDYYMSGRFYTYDGLYNSKTQTDTYKSYNLRVKTGYQATPWLKFTNNFEYDYNKYYYPLTFTEGNGNIYRNIADEGHPSSPMFNPDGTLTYAAVYSVGDLLYGKTGRSTVNEQFKNTTAFTAKFLKNSLRVNGDFTYRKKVYDYSYKQVYTEYARSVDANGNSIMETIKAKTGNTYTEAQNHTDYLATNIYAEYEKTFGKKHNFKAMAGWNYEQSRYRQLRAVNKELLTDDIESINLTMGTDTREISGSWSAYDFGGAFARINYNYDERYLVEFNGRYDGSSRFPSNRRWAFFPSASFGWRVSQEPWWHVSADAISSLKLRFSYGALGNANGLSNYMYKQTLSTSKSSYILDGLRQQYMSKPSALPASLTWETAATYDGGIDVAFLNSRLSLTADYYVRKTTDMICAGPTVPDVFGATSPRGNYADMSTYGWEVTVNWKDGFELGGKPFNYSVKASLSDYYSVIDKYNNKLKTISPYSQQSERGYYYEGMRLGEIWGFVSTGLWQNQADIDAAVAKAKAAGQSYYNPLVQTTKTYQLRPGDVKYEDLNGNGYIDYGDLTVDNPGDRKILGNALPRYMYSFNLSADWNNFWVSAFFQGVGKQDWAPSNESSFLWGQFNRPYNQMPTWHVGNYWTPENTDAYLPRYTGYYAPLYSGHRYITDRYMQNVRYFRLKNLQLGYNLPKKLVSKMHMQQLGIYFAGENLFTCSPLYKLTKDINVGNARRSDVDLQSDNQGDGYSYPMMKSFTLGLNITF